MNETPTAGEFWLDSYFSDSISQEDKKLWLECNEQAKHSINIMIEFAKIKVTEALKEASKKAIASEYWGNNIVQPQLIVDKNSILNAYPLKNIK